MSEERNMTCHICKQNKAGNSYGKVTVDQFSVSFEQTLCERCAGLLLVFFEKIRDTLYVAADETIQQNLDMIKDGMERNGEEFPLPETGLIEKLLDDIFKKDIDDKS